MAAQSLGVEPAQGIVGVIPSSIRGQIQADNVLFLKRGDTWAERQRDGTAAAIAAANALWAAGI